MDVGIERGDAVRCRERAQLRGLIERIADFQGFHFLDEEFFEVVGDALIHYEPLGGDAGLAIVLHACFHRGSGRFLKVCAGHHDEGIAASKLEHDFFDFLCRSYGNLNSCAFTSGQRGSSDSSVGNNAADFVGANKQSLKRSLRETGALKNFFNQKSALRDVGGMFEKSHIAGHQRRRGEAKHLPEREIPGHHREHGTQGLISNETA